jgi:signal transduction histidine kinase/ActR/RegA family two-component response regulator
MSVDPQVIRAEEHAEIGDLLQRSIGFLIERWSRRAVEEQPNARRVHHAVLVDHMRDLLTTLGRSLAESKDLHTLQHCLTANRHGEQRWEAGWSLPEVVRDYQILRLVVLEFLQENLERPLAYRELLAIGLALDEALAASVVMYVHGREQHQRALEDQRAEQEKHAHEQLQKQADALQQADRRKNEFLAMLAHELRNPLEPIRNAVEIVRVQGPAAPDLHWARGVIDRQLTQLTSMVDDLLDVSRIARGKIRLQKEPIDLASVVQQAVETARPLIDCRKQALAVSLPDEPLWLEADAPRLTQVLVNLLTNSAKYTEVGGRIWLEVERDGLGAVLKVRDTGIGIAAEQLPFVFEPFVQEDRAAERAYGGLGLGLSLVRSLVELHGGKVEVFSNGPGQGSEFVVHLPLLGALPATGASRRDKPKASAKGPARRILVVDDNYDSADSLALLLRFAGHEVRTAYDGRMALEAARAQAPDVVLLDIGLPGTDGHEIARRIRHELGLFQALLIALTGYGQEEDKRRSHEAGFNAHLVKPVNLEELRFLLAAPRLDSQPLTR